MMTRFNMVTAARQRLRLSGDYHVQVHATFTTLAKGAAQPHRWGFLAFTSPVAGKVQVYAVVEFQYELITEVHANLFWELFDKYRHNGRG